MTLWKSPQHPGEAALLDRKVYENQCAINLGAALIRSGVDMRGYTGRLSWEKNKQRCPIRAQELADWLPSGAARISAEVEKFGGKEAFDKVQSKRGMSGRTGTAFFQNYWGTGAQGDHIDLWNGSRLTDWRTWARINLRFGDSGCTASAQALTSRRRKAVWFWCSGWKLDCPAQSKGSKVNPDLP